MKILKKILTLIILTTFIYIPKNNMPAASPISNKNTPVRIAVFLDNSNAMFISLLKQKLELIQKENEDKVEFTFFNASDNQTHQNESIENALKENFNLFIISIITPNSKDVESTLRKIMEANIPMILNPDPTQDIINFVKPYKRFVVIGGDYEQSGTIEGQILADKWNSNKESIDKNHDNILQYVMLKGRTGSPLVDLRVKYSILALNNAGIKTEELASPYCEWLEDCAESSVESLFLKYGNKIEAIISNNDAMAVGAIEALQKYGYNKGNKESTIPVVGIDGMPAAIDLINKGFMTGTVAVDYQELAKVLYTVGMNLAANKYPLENTNYKFDDTGFTIHLTYKKCTK